MKKTGIVITIIALLLVIVLIGGKVAALLGRLFAYTEVKCKTPKP